MIKAIIIDDEQGGIDSLKWELQPLENEVEVIGSTTDPLTGKELIERKKPDLVFLDIEMPRMNGFDFLKQFEIIDFEVIFVTAFDEFALKAFEVSAIDYLLKPVDDDSLKSAITKVGEKRNQGQLASKLELLIENLRKSDQSFDRIALPSSNGLDFVSTSSILRCESDSNYTTVFLDNEQKLVISKTLKEIEALLPDSTFFRIHHSHLINLRFITKYNKGKSGSVVLSDGSVIPVSRNKKTEFLDQF